MARQSELMLELLFGNLDVFRMPANPESRKLSCTGEWLASTRLTISKEFEYEDHGLRFSGGSVTETHLYAVY